MAVARGWITSWKFSISQPITTLIIPKNKLLCVLDANSLIADWLKKLKTAMRV